MAGRLAAEVDPAPVKAACDMLDASLRGGVVHPVLQSAHVRRQLGIHHVAQLPLSEHDEGRDGDVSAQGGRDKHGCRENFMAGRVKTKQRRQRRSRRVKIVPHLVDGNGNNNSLTAASMTDDERPRGAKSGRTLFHSYRRRQVRHPSLEVRSSKDLTGLYSLGYILIGPWP